MIGTSQINLYWVYTNSNMIYINATFYYLRQYKQQGSQNIENLII